MVLLVFIVGGFGIYQVVQIWNQTDTVYEEAQSTLFAELPGVIILSQDIYNGEEQWVWFEIQDAEGVRSHVLIPTKKKEDQLPYIMRKVLGGISQADAEVFVTHAEHPKEITRTVLGVKEGRIVWEITYRDDSDKLSYYYVDFTTGDFVKSITL